MEVGERPQHFVFITNSVEWEPFTSAVDIIEELSGAGLWLMSQHAPFRGSYRPGDKVLFYAAGRTARYFVGDAEIGGRLEPATADAESIALRLGLRGFLFAVPLRSVRIWEKPLPLKPLVESLGFIKDKKNWGLNLRQSAARIPNDDYDIVLTHASLP